MKGKLFLIFVLGLFLISIVGANLGTFKQKECVQIVTNLNTSSVNISGITSPSPIQEILITNQEMTKDGTFFNYTFCNTSKTGVYTYGYCDFSGNCYSNDFIISFSGNNTDFELGIILFNSFFLLLCLVLVVLSSKLIKPEQSLSSSQLYQIKKEHEFRYLISVLKNKLWVLGVFGIYLFSLLFFSFSYQLVSNLGMLGLVQLFENITVVVSWGLIPFILFWLVYVILFFYKKTVDVMRYQFGNFSTKGQEAMTR